MESAHPHDTPPVVHLLTDRQGHGLRFELDLLQAPQCSPAGGSVHSFTHTGDAAMPLGPAPSSHQICASWWSAARAAGFDTRGHREGRGRLGSPNATYSPRIEKGVTFAAKSRLSRRL